MEPTPKRNSIGKEVFGFGIIGITIAAITASVYYFIRWWCRSGDDERGDTEVDEVDNLPIREIDLESQIQRFLDEYDGTVQLEILESRFPTIDLHGHTAKAAKDEVARILDDHYQQYGRGNGEKKVRIITGRGSHSVDGIPVLKPITESYLKNNYRRYWWAFHRGSVLVDLSSKINTNDKGRRRRRLN